MDKKPIIGISSSITVENEPFFMGYKRCYLSKDYVDAIIKNGGIPFIIPLSEDKEVIEAQVDFIDALLLSGGVDVNPLYYGEEPQEKLHDILPERDTYEDILLRKAKQKNIPILGICRGMQFMNAFHGGTLYQDLSYIGKENILKHCQDAYPEIASHSINCKEDSKIFEMLESKNLKVNSYHHQALKKVADNFIVSAVAPDGVIEAIEDKNYNFLVGVQWHPEMMHRNHDVMNNIFKKFIDEAKKNK